MRSPHIYSNCVSPYQHKKIVSNRELQQSQVEVGRKDDVEIQSTNSEGNSVISSIVPTSTSDTTSFDKNTGASSSKRKSFIPQPRASLSSFAVPSWNNGTTGEHCSNIRVVARIRPSSTKGSTDEKKALFAIRDNDTTNTTTCIKEKNINNIKEQCNQNGIILDQTSEIKDGSSFSSSLNPSNTMKSSSPGSSKHENVADIAARFNTTPSSPLTPASLPSIITTPTKFIRESSNYNNNNRRESFYSPPSRKWNQESQEHTPIRTNGGSGLIPSSTMRQTFIQKPGCSSLSNSSMDSSCCSSSLIKKNDEDMTHQIAAGLTDPKTFDFDAVFDSTTSQRDVYNKTIGDAIRRNIFRGFNTTVLSYGQMNSGKTYSMYSDDKYTNKKCNGAHDEENDDQFVKENDGIAYRAIYDLFMAKKRHATGGEVMINATIIELYNDRIIDLLGYKKSTNTSSSSSLGSRGLTTIALKSPSHAREVIQNAFKRKKKIRSHTICTLQITINPAVNRNVTTGKMSSMTSVDVVNAKLTLVDLAGSENNTNNEKRRSTTPQQRRSESSIINKDLFVLGQCITGLAEKSENGGKSIHIPFRDSKLTTLLRGSLGGNCCTVMIACVSPDESNLEDSLNTLRYAERTRNITNRVKKNMIKTSGLTPAEGAALRRENKVLKSQLLDMTRKYQFLRRGRRDSTSSTYFVEDDDASIDIHDKFLFSPTNTSITDLKPISIQSDKSEAERWRMKFEKLSDICKNAGLSTSGAELDEKDEATLVSHQIEILELKELLQRLIQTQTNDNASVTSGLTFESFDFPDDQSTISGGSMISSIAGKSLKSELLQAEYIRKTKIMESEDKKLSQRIEEKKQELAEIEKTKILQTSTMKLKLEKEASLHEESITCMKNKEDALSESIKVLESKEKKLEKKMEAIEIQLQGKEEAFAQELKDNESKLHQILEELRNQINLLEVDKAFLESEIASLGELKSSIIEEKEKEIRRVELNMTALKSQVKTLNEERLALFNEVEDLQNASRLVIEYSQEQLERQQCEEKLEEVKKEVQQLQDERGALQKEVAALSSVNKKQNDQKKDLEKELQSLKNKVISLESIDRRDINRNILQERTNDTSSFIRPPLPSPIQSKRSHSPSPSMRSADESIMSTISLSNVPDHLYFPEYNPNEKSILFGDVNESFDQDHKSIHSCFSENSSLNSEQMGIRMHAQRLLFWADKSITRNNRIDENDSRYDFDKENSQHKLVFDNGQSVSEKRISVSSASRRRCTGDLPESLFSGKSEHTEFFLPKLGMACKNSETYREISDPMNLKSFLRTWQVSFLNSIGVRTAEGLVRGEKRFAKDMAKAMKRWRHKKKMKPARTKSCLVALQIWSKVAKSVLQSAADKKRASRKDNHRNSFDFPFENDHFNDPMFMEVGVSERPDDDNCSFASVSTLGNNMTMNCMDDSLSLMEGEYEI